MVSVAVQDPTSTRQPTATRELSLPGTLDAPGRARRFVCGVLAQASCPSGDSAQLITSELVTNSVRHSRSARAGGAVAIRVTVTAAASVRIEVTDDGPALVPQPHSRNGKPGSIPEGGRGMDIISVLARDHGSYDGRDGTTHWALLSWNESP